MITKNPWLGLASYEEPKNDGTDCQFCGRDEETLEMVRLIDNNLFITLYGSSGIGKTSLLRAGVIPILRRKDYYPLYVRLSEQPKDISYAEAIVRKLQNSNLTMEEGAAMNHIDGNDRLFLWEYFATTHFLNEGREVYPVIILDQFEEVFREGDKAKAELLLRQIYLLINDELEMPDEAGWSSDTNYRFVASIREDFLFVLEDSIDENSLDLYKHNRYRLRPMKPEQAQQVVLKPGKECIEETEKDAIAERIIALSKRQQGNDIDTLMLSLVCAGTYEKKCGEKIVFSDLAVWKNNPMEVYYKDAVKGLTANQIRFIQQHLIREDGSRRRVDASEVKAILGETTYLELTKGKNRLFTIGDRGQVELLHDQLGMAVCEERKAFEEQERKKKQRRRLLTIIGLSLLFAIMGLGFGGYSLKQKRHAEMARQIAENATEEKDNTIKKLAEANSAKEAAYLEAKKQTKKAEDATKEKENTIKELEEKNKTLAQLNAQLEEEKEHLRSANWDKMDAKSKIIALTGEEILDDDPYLASIIALNALPSNISNPEFPITPEAESLLRKATNNKNVTFKGHSESVEKIAISNDENLMASFSDDKTIIIWDVNTGVVRNTIPYNGYSSNIYSLHFSKDNKYIVINEKNKLNIIDLEKESIIGTLDKWDYAKDSLITNPNGNSVVFAGYGIPQLLKDINHSRKENRHVLDRIMSKDSSVVITLYDDSSRVYSNSKTGKILFSDETRHYGIPLKGHTGGVNYICFNQDSTYIATASRDSTIRIWNALTGDSIRVLRGHKGSVETVAFSPDCKYLVSASKDSTARVWDLSSGKEVTKYKHDKDVKSAIFSPNGDYVASFSSYGKEIKIWYPLTGRTVKNISGHSSWVNSVIFSPDSKRVISCSYDKSIKIWDLEVIEPDVSAFLDDAPIRNADVNRNGDKLIMAMPKAGIGLYDMKNKNIEYPYMGLTTGCQMSDDKNYIVANNSNVITIWETSTDKRKTLSAPNNDISNVIITPNNYIVSGHDDGTISIWDIESEKIIKSVKAHNEGINAIAPSPNGKVFATASSDSTIRLWNSDSFKNIGSPIHCKGNIGSLTFINDSEIQAKVNDSLNIWNFHTHNIVHEKKLPKEAWYFGSKPNGNEYAYSVCGKDTNYVVIVNRDTNKEIRTLNDGFFGGIPICYSPDGNYFVESSLNHNTILIYDTKSWEVVDTLIAPKGNDGFFSVSFSKDGKELVATNWLNGVFVWNFQERANPKQFVNLKFNYAKYSPDGSKIALLANDNTIRIWDADSYKELCQMEEMGTNIYSFAFSHDSRLIASAQPDFSIKIGDISNGNLLMSFKGHTKSIYSLAFSPDDKNLVTASADSTIRIWDIKTGLLQGVLRGHVGLVTSVAYSLDGKFVVSVGNDKTIRYWDVQEMKELKSITIDGSQYYASFSPTGKFLITYPNEIVIRDATTGKEIQRLPKASYASFSPTEEQIYAIQSDGIKIWDFPKLDVLVERTRQRFEKRKLSSEEKKRFYLE